MPAVTDQAVCIRHWDWSETSQTVELFARERGIVRALAKGSKRERSPFSGGLEVLTAGQMMAIIKPNTTLATLTAWDLRETFPAVRQSLNAFYAGMYIADLIHHLLREADPHPKLYDTLLQTLRGLSGSEPNARDHALLRFQWVALDESGHRPELDQSVAGRDPLPASGPLGFHPRLGGLVADPADVDTPDQVSSDRPWRVRRATVELLRSLRDSPYPPQSASLSDGSTLDRANRLLAAYTREILGAEPPSMRVLFGPLTNDGP